MDWLDFLLKPYREDYTTLQIALEAIAVAFGIASVLFAKARNIWVYPTGIVSTGIFVYLLFRWTLYGDMLTNVYYTVMSIYGWVLWHTESRDGVHVEVKKMTLAEYFKSAYFFVGSFFLVLAVYYFFRGKGFDFQTTDYLDATSSGIFLVAMLLMAKQKIEHWLFWILGNVLSIYLYLSKGLALTAFQYAVFLVLAIMGWLSWQKYLAEKKMG